MLDFDESLKTALNLTESNSQVFLRAGLAKVRDLLFTLPLRYEDRSHITPIHTLQDNTTVQVCARVQQVRFAGNRTKLLQVWVEDQEGGLMRLAFFHFYPSQVKQFENRRLGLFYGKVRSNGMHYEMAHPQITWLKDDEPLVLPDALQAVYPTVKGLSQSRLRQSIHTLLKKIPEHQDLLTQEGYPSFFQALREIHCPYHFLLPEEGVLSLAQKRLALEELMAHQLSLRQLRSALQEKPAPALPEHSALLNACLQALPFSLTSAQECVRQEIARDLAQNTAMMRLVQGDVGSGKTVIALLACIQAIAAGKQAIFMAPTELLAQQHALSIQKLLNGMPIRSAVLISKLPSKEKRSILQAITSGEIQLIIGTHAVFQEKVQYCDLALVVVDEQHRFGVHQRLQLQEKSPQGLHQLVLTATPIPRTLAMSMYGELDTSIIDTLPAGRKPIRTSVMSNQKREALIQRVGAICRQGGQAYWVCPLIEESEILECENAEAIAHTLAQQLAGVSVALVHGRMDTSLRNQTMQDFAQGKIALLVATTVIEVGVDVPNASLMIIENSERFGLSQLHQLRGRVGRGSKQSDCILMYQAPLKETAKRRLNIMRETQDGFRIAEEDLQIRGAGELLGTRQTGVAGLRIANIERDQELQKLAQAWAEKYQDTLFAQELLQRWVGYKMRYLQV